MDCLAIADSIQTSISQKSPSNTWMLEIFDILEDPPMSDSAKTCSIWILSKLKEWLLLVDAQHLPQTCKLWLFQHFIIAEMSWCFTALDLAATFVKTLQSVSTKFLKNWSGLPRPANTSILFLEKSGQAGLHITNLVNFGNKCRLFAWTSLRTPLISGAENCTKHTFSAAKHMDKEVPDSRWACLGCHGRRSKSPCLLPIAL